MGVLLLSVSGCSVLDQINQTTEQQLEDTPDLVKEILAQNAELVWVYLPHEDAWRAEGPRPLFPVREPRKGLPDDLPPSPPDDVVPVEESVTALEHTTCTKDPEYQPGRQHFYEVWQSAYSPWLAGYTPWAAVVETTAYDDIYHSYNLNYASCRHDSSDRLGNPNWMTQLHMQNSSGYYTVSGTDYVWESIAASSFSLLDWYRLLLRRGDVAGRFC
jgi:hypothetical protein